MASPVIDLSGAENPASRFYWGPRLWRVFHLLAEISDRRDMYMLWTNLLRVTGPVVPCDTCRNHIGSYIRSHAFMRAVRPHLITGEAVRQIARQNLLDFHNNVNERLGKPVVPREQLATLYGGDEKTRGAILSEIHKLLEEINAAWTPLIHRSISGAHFTTWKKHINLMLALAAGGPN
jgi:hypothetical protein